MKRSIMAMVCLMSVLAATAPVQAHRGHARPQITRFEFVDRPLKAGTLERLIVVAHDPDSWISEIQVQWEDPNEMGGVIFAHTYCLQDPEFENPGTPAKLKLDLEFENATTYHVQARAISEKRCEGGNDTRISATLERDIVVKDPSESFSDPDDSSGPLDVVGLTHSQYADDAGLRTHVTHDLTFGESLGTTPLGGADDFVQILFDTDSDTTTFERTLTVDVVNGLLTAEMTNRAGSRLGEAAVTVDGPTLSVDMVKGLIKRGLERYRWVAVTHDSSSGGCATVACADRAPESQSFAHRL